MRENSWHMFVWVCAFCICLSIWGYALCLSQLCSVILKINGLVSSRLAMNLAKHVPVMTTGCLGDT